MSITVKYADGTTENYHDVTAWSIEGDVLNIRGKIDGEEVVKTYAIRWGTVRRIAVEGS